MCLFEKSEAHLREVDESYLKHFYFIFWIAFKLLILAFVAIIHGLIPALFPTTVSRNLDLISRECARRRNKHITHPRDYRR